MIIDTDAKPDFVESFQRYDHHLKMHVIKAGIHDKSDVLEELGFSRSLIDEIRQAMEENKKILETLTRRLENDVIRMFKPDKLTD